MPAYYALIVTPFLLSYFNGGSEISDLITLTGKDAHRAFSDTGVNGGIHIHVSLLGRGGTAESVTTASVTATHLCIPGTPAELLDRA